MTKFKFKINDQELTLPNDCESATVKTGRNEEFVFQATGIEKWAEENPKEFTELYNALIPKKKRNKK